MSDEITEGQKIINNLIDEFKSFNDLKSVENDQKNEFISSGVKQLLALLDSLKNLAIHQEIQSLILDLHFEIVSGKGDEIRDKVDDLVHNLSNKEDDFYSSFSEKNYEITDSVKKLKIISEYSKRFDNRIVYYLDEACTIIHRDNDLPAVIYDNGSQFWYQNDKLHREIGPAFIHTNGRIYFLSDQKYSEEEFYIKIGKPYLLTFV